MSLFLIETPTQSSEEVQTLQTTIDNLVKSADVELVELRTTTKGDRLFAVVEHTAILPIIAAIRASAPLAEVNEVRLVGATIDEAKRSSSGSFMTEWDLPENLDMDTYLARKAEKTPLYAQVPQVSFNRTYVRIDMAKCLCFYDASSEEDVVLAREAVSTPIDRLHELA